MSLIYKGNTLNSYAKVTYKNQNVKEIHYKPKNATSKKVWVHDDLVYVKITNNHRYPLSVWYEYNGKRVDWKEGQDLPVPKNRSITLKWSYGPKTKTAAYDWIVISGAFADSAVIQGGATDSVVWSFSSSDSLNFFCESYWIACHDGEFISATSIGEILTMHVVGSDPKLYRFEGHQFSPVDVVLPPQSGGSFLVSDLYSTNDISQETMPLRLTFSSNHTGHYLYSRNTATAYPTPVALNYQWTTEYSETILANRNPWEWNLYTDEVPLPYIVLTGNSNIIPQRFKLTWGGYTQTINSDQGDVWFCDIPTQDIDVEIESLINYLGNGDYVNSDINGMKWYVRGSKQRRRMRITRGQAHYLNNTLKSMSVQAYFKYSNGTAPAKLINNCPFPVNVSYHTEKTNAGETGTNASRTLSGNETYSFNLADRAWYSDNHMTAKLNYAELDDGTYYPTTNTKNFEDKSGSGTTVNLI